MLTLKLRGLSAATRGVVGDVRRLAVGVVLGGVDGVLVAVGEKAGAEENAGSLTLTAGGLVAELAIALSDEVADPVVRAAGMRAAALRHGCTTSPTTTTTATTLTALAATTPSWLWRKPNFASGMVPP